MSTRCKLIGAMAVICVLWVSAPAAAQVTDADVTVRVTAEPAAIAAGGETGATLRLVATYETIDGETLGPDSAAELYIYPNGSETVVAPLTVSVPAMTSERVGFAGAVDQDFVDTAETETFSGVTTVDCSANVSENSFTCHFATVSTRVYAKAGAVAGEYAINAAEELSLAFEATNIHTADGGKRDEGTTVVVPNGGRLGSVMVLESTPALPLFGALVLGAGLMAAGRRRLRA